MKEGWVDYVTPQIYWSIGFTVAPYDVIANWWNVNSYGIPVYIGQAAYRIGNHTDTKWKENDQVPKQIRLNRSLASVKGSIFFSSKSFIPNPLGINDSLKNNFYKYPALIPAIKDSIFDKQFPLTFFTDNSGITLQWKQTANERSLSPHSRYVIYRFNDKEKIDFNNASKIIDIVSNTNPYASLTQLYKDDTARPKKKYIYIVTALNRYQVESKATQAYPVKNYKKYWRTYAPLSL
jgi:hypothetical protein